MTSLQYVVVRLYVYDITSVSLAEILTKNIKDA